MSYITKPFSLSVLLLKIEAHFRHRTGGVSYPLSECSGWTGDIIAVASGNIQDGNWTDSD